MDKYKLLTLLFISILLVGTISAFNFDNIKNDISFSKGSNINIGNKQINYNTIWEKYKPIEIKNSFGFGETLFEGAIDEHTESCSDNCYSTIDINLADDGILIDDIEFYNINNDDSRNIKNNMNYNIYISNEEIKNIIQEYEWTCEDTGSKYSNGTNIQICSKNNIGSHTEYSYNWIEYNLGDEVLSGDYKIKITGKKSNKEIVDWVIKTNGEWLNEWAIWGLTDIYTVDDHGLSLGDAVGVVNKRGATFIMNKNAQLMNFTKGSSSAATSCFLYTYSGYNLLNSSTYVGDVCSMNYNLLEGVEYIVNSWAGGGNYNRVTAAGTLPINDTNLNWTGASEDGTKYTNAIQEIQTITTKETRAISYVTLNSPADNYISNSNSITFNCSAVVTGASFVNISLVTNTSGTFETTNTTTTNGGNISESGIADGIYLWSCLACDDDSDCGFADENRTITVDTTEPTISFTSPASTINYHKIGNNLSLNWSLTETNKDSCWFEYNNTNTTVICDGGNYSFTPVSGKQSLTFYANDTANNIGSNTTTWSYNILENSQTYNELTYGSSYEDFILNITYDSSEWSAISATLMYNNTEYIGAKAGTGDTIEFSTSIQVPTQATEVNKTFYWQIGLTNASGITSYNSTFNNQTISPIVLHLCDAVYTIPTLNFTIKEAGTFALLNGSIEATFDYWGGGDGTISQEYNYANTTDNNTNYAFCIAPAYANFSTTATISYYKSGYDRREYYFNNYTISNDTDEISLYLSSSATTDIFTITVIDEDENAVSGATVDVQRWDIGTNNFYSIGSIVTTQDGTGTINLRLYDTWYRYQVTYNGILYLVTEPVKEATTSRTLEISLVGENPYYNFDNIQYSLTYNNQTNVSIFTFTDPTGALQTGCLNVLKMTGYGNTLIYDSCVESSSGTLSYYINDTGTYVIRAIFKLGAEYGYIEKIVDEIVVNGIAERFTIIGKFGQVISLVFTGTMAMVGIASGSIPLGLFLIIVSLFVELKIGWINISSSVLYGFISIAILIALGLRKK